MIEGVNRPHKLKIDAMCAVRKFKIFILIIFFSFFFSFLFFLSFFLFFFFFLFFSSFFSFFFLSFFFFFLKKNSFIFFLSSAYQIQLETQFFWAVKVLTSTSYSLDTIFD